MISLIVTQIIPFLQHSLRDKCCSYQLPDSCSLSPSFRQSVTMFSTVLQIRRCLFLFCCRATLSLPDYIHMRCTNKPLLYHKTLSLCTTDIPPYHDVPPSKILARYFLFIGNMLCPPKLMSHWDSLL